MFKKVCGWCNFVVFLILLIIFVVVLLLVLWIGFLVVNEVVNLVVWLCVDLIDLVGLFDSIYVMLFDVA